MTLIKYAQPNSDLFGKRFSDIMDEFFNDAVSNRRNSFVPGIDISETEKQYIVEAEIPGVEKKDIHLDIENGMLTITGERKFENEESDKHYHRVETRYGSFTRSFRLPDNIKEDSIQASYKNGILHISINKDEEKAKKQIKIQ